MAKMKQPLRIEETVRLVLPTHADFGDGHAHVARVSDPSKTVCGTRITYWWFWHQDIWSVAALREAWDAAPYKGPVHFQGTHLGGHVNMKPDVCANCWMLVVHGFRPRWGNPDYPADWCRDCYNPPQNCWCDVTLAESLAMHGFEIEA